jgi:pimeloyl-ACP methyl ester carboxylesterase
VQKSFGAESTGAIGAGHIVNEPVFHGKTKIIEAGREHTQSMILVHGVGDEASTTWYPVLPFLAQYYHVICFDLPGFGIASKDSSLYNPKNYAKLIKWVKERYAKGPVILMGHSMGGALSLYYAGTYPEDLRFLILVDAAGVLHRAAFTKNFIRTKGSKMVPEVLRQSFGKQLAQVGEFIDTTVEDLEKEDASEKINTLLGESLLRNFFFGEKAGAIAALAAADKDFSGVIEKIDVPALIIWGEKDEVAPLRTGKLLAYKLKNSTFRIMKDAGHVPMVEQTEKFADIVLQGLKPPWNKGPEKEKTLVIGSGKGTCLDTDSMVFSGSYASIEITNCRQVLLENVTTASLTSTGSEVSIENSRVQGAGTAVSIKNSKLVATGMTIEAQVGIHASASRLDLAGVDILAKDAAVETPDNAVVLFSLCHVNSRYTFDSLHAIRKVTAESPL